MNHGYAELHNVKKLILQKRDEPDRYFIQLYHKIASAGNLKNRHVLEIGCGTGMWYELLKDTGIKYVGTDASSEMLEWAKKDYPEADFRVMDGYDLTFKDNSFDYVLINDVLKHVDKPDIIIKKALKIAKKAILLSNTLVDSNTSKGVE